MAATLNDKLNNAKQTNTIVCTKTGISLVICSDSKGIDTLNALLKAGKLTAGVNPGNIFLSEDERAKLKAAKQWNGSNYRWAARKASGWVQYDGWTIGQHNIAILKDAGFEADKATRSKGQVRNRQYVPSGTTAFKSPKETDAIVAPSGPLFGGSNSPKETVQPSPKETVCDAPKETASYPFKEGKEGIAPYPFQGLELGKHGGHQSYVSRMMKDVALTQGQAKALWAEARRHYSRLSKGETSELADPSALLRSKKMSMSMESKGLIYGDQPKAETWVSQVERSGDLTPQPEWAEKHYAETAAPKEPKAHSSEGTTVPVKPEALIAFLSGMEGAIVVGFADGNALVAL